MQSYLDLYDFRVRVTDMYQRRNAALLANGADDAAILHRFRQERDGIFARHPQSALDEEQKRSFKGIPYFPFNPAMRFAVTVDFDVEHKQQEVVMNASESMKMTTVGHLHFPVEQQEATLSLYWLDIYGGGLFLPFRDATSPKESYGAGRYLFDTIKGSNFLSSSDENGHMQIVLDFNYAYNPSCAYNDAWTCPLAPIENRLSVAISAGEKKFK